MENIYISYSFTFTFHILIMSKGYKSAFKDFLRFLRCTVSCSTSSELTGGAWRISQSLGRVPLRWDKKYWGLTSFSQRKISVVLIGHSLHIVFAIGLMGQMVTLDDYVIWCEFVPNMLNWNRGDLHNNCLFSNLLLHLSKYSICEEQPYLTVSCVLHINLLIKNANFLSLNQKEWFHSTVPIPLPLPVPVLCICPYYSWVYESIEYVCLLLWVCKVYPQLSLITMEIYR